MPVTQTCGTQAAIFTEVAVAFGTNYMTAFAQPRVTVTAGTAVHAVNVFLILTGRTVTAEITKFRTVFTSIVTQGANLIFLKATAAGSAVTFVVDQAIDKIPIAGLTHLDAQLTPVTPVTQILIVVTAYKTFGTVIVIRTFNATVAMITNIRTLSTESARYTGIRGTAGPALRTMFTVVYCAFHTHAAILAECIVLGIAGAAVTTVIVFITVTVCFVTAVIAAISDPTVADMSAAIVAVRLLVPRAYAERRRGDHAEDDHKRQQHA